MKKWQITELEDIIKILTGDNTVLREELVKLETEYKILEDNYKILLDKVNVLTVSK